MKVRALFPLAAAAGFWLAGPATAQQPAPAANPNQTLADNVAYRLRALGVAAVADVSIVAQDGTVNLTGSVKDPAQKDLIVRAVKDVAGVIVVRDGLQTPGIVQVQVGGGGGTFTPPVTGGGGGTNPPVTGGGGTFIPPGTTGGGSVLPAPISPMPLAPFGGPPTGPIVEPAPLGVPGQFSPDMQAPNLPPHAWPTYAPYNNLSRVAYPTAHPYNAFPFIGPYYPFPKVPLGWRKVTLEWEDGHWYLGRNSAPQDYWRVKFW